MAVYPFIKIDTIDTSKEVIVEVFIPITGDVNVYNGENGLEAGQWKRYWGGGASVNFSFNTKVDPYSSNSFVKATDKKMTMGEMWELSKEMSEKRAKKEGVDPVKQKMYKEYERKNGVKHQDQIAQEKRQKVKEKMDKLGVEIQH
jgi:hypothetical protein